MQAGKKAVRGGTRLVQRCLRLPPRRRHSAVALISMFSMRTSSSGLSVLGWVLTCKEGGQRARPEGAVSRSAGCGGAAACEWEGN